MKHKEVFENQVPAANRYAAQFAMERSRLLLHLQSLPVTVRWFLSESDQGFASASGTIIHTPWTYEVYGYAENLRDGSNTIWLSASFAPAIAAVTVFHEMRHILDYKTARGYEALAPKKYFAWDDDGWAGWLSRKTLRESEDWAHKFQVAQYSEAAIIGAIAERQNPRIHCGCTNGCHCNLKQFNVDLVKFAADKSTRTLKGVASVFDSLVDSFPEKSIVVRGAFEPWLKRWRAGVTRRVPILWQHYPEHVIGNPISLIESRRGLEIEFSLVNTQGARDVLTLLEDGVINGLSIGFNIVMSEMREHGNDENVLHITEVDLWEISLVTFAAGSLARVEQVCNANVCRAL